MAAATYSLTATGVLADSPFALTTQKFPDADINGNVCGEFGKVNNGVFALPALTMQQGGLVQCQGPDGGLHLYKIDAERSLPGKPVLIFVGP